MLSQYWEILITLFIYMKPFDSTLIENLFLDSLA